jgi:hypothetical protein
MNSVVTHFSPPLSSPSQPGARCHAWQGARARIWCSLLFGTWVTLHSTGKVGSTSEQCWTAYW